MYRHGRSVLYRSDLYRVIKGYWTVHEALNVDNKYLLANVK